MYNNMLVRSELWRNFTWKSRSFER